MNRTCVVGRLTADPELRYTQSGVAVANFRVAVDRPFTNQQGQREADFLPVVAWRKLAETVSANLGKGRLVAVEGRLQSRSYQAQDGSTRWVVEIVADDVRFLDWPASNGANGNGAATAEQAGYSDADAPPEMAAEPALSYAGAEMI